ncbi:MAG: multicopper oxidase family protein [Gammaproteobacteria bacterium]|nr:MAG: multicopper oxidase family protein [Gammaproteobacteria bacterium]
MNRIRFKSQKQGGGLARLFSALAVMAAFFLPLQTQAAIDTVTGPNFTLTAGEGYASFADGGRMYSWGYSVAGTPMQLPGPTLEVTEGDVVTITLNNNLPAAAGNVSIVFPGQQVSSTGGVKGALTAEAPIGGSVTYTFTARKPGTYEYHSGTHSDLQVEMGLYGALIVRPASIAGGIPTNPVLKKTYAGCAYDHPDTCYDREYLFLLSEMDRNVHELVAQQVANGAKSINIGTGEIKANYFMINGRSGPDTLGAPGRELLPNQPYNIVPRMHPGEKLLLRIVGAGQHMHPFHTHGNNARLLARDGNLLVNDNNKLDGPDLFTFPATPGGTMDALFRWTGKDLGWDMYGHTAADNVPCNDTDGDGYNDDPAGEPGEYCADHNKAIPVQLPDLNVMAFGGFYGGSPYLGNLGSLPPGEGGLNPNAGFAYMWHSHAERELTNYNVYPGGMLTMLIIEAPSTIISPTRP